MYSYIIQVSAKTIKRKVFMNFFDLVDDPYLATHSNWHGLDGESSKVLDTVADELRPYAFVNKKRRTITFKKPSSVRRALRKNLLEAYKNAKNGADTYEALIDHIDTCGVTDILLRYGEGTQRCHPLRKTVHDYLQGELPRVIHFGGIVLYNKNDR